MNLKNYTSKVEVSKSVAKIMDLLVEAGAKNINMEYQDKQLKSITFLLDVRMQTIPFRLEAKPDAVFKVMWNEVKRPKEGTKERIQHQSGMTAWKILSDWVEIQVSMVMLEQADLVQLFLPYAYNPSEQKTFYDVFNEKGMRMLNP